MKHESMKEEAKEEKMEHSGKMKMPGKMHHMGKKKGMGKMEHMKGKK